MHNTIEGQITMR